MNLFYLENNHQKTIMWLTNCHNCIDKQIGDNHFYYLNDKLVGFNIFLEKDLGLKPGRILFTPRIEQELSSKYNIDFQSIARVHFLVGQINEIKKIENTHLSLCQVDLGKEVVQIICGANNVTLNLKVVVAPIGIIMNNGLEIKQSKIQGYDSFGMLCSQKELQINGFNDNGIIELNDKYRPGDIFLNCYSK